LFRIGERRPGKYLFSKIEREKYMKKYFLPWLLFHANKSKDKRFYPIKNKILSKYGKKIDIEV